MVNKTIDQLMGQNKKTAIQVAHHSYGHILDMRLFPSIQFGMQIKKEVKNVHVCGSFSCLLKLAVLCHYAMFDYFQKQGHFTK